MSRPGMLAEALSNAGRPGKVKEMQAIERALIAAGADRFTAYTATCLAYDIASGYDWKILETASAVQQVMRRMHADKHPNGQWARLFAHHGHAAQYLPQNHPDVFNWATLPGPRAAVAADFDPPGPGVGPLPGPRS